jgi:hypothetical protein
MVGLVDLPPHQELAHQLGQPEAEDDEEHPRHTQGDEPNQQRHDSPERERDAEAGVDR